MGRIEASHASREQHLVQIAERLSERHEAELAVRGVQCGADAEPSSTVPPPPPSLSLICAVYRACATTTESKSRRKTDSYARSARRFVPRPPVQLPQLTHGRGSPPTQLNSFVAMLSRLQGGQQQQGSRVY